MKYNSKDQLLAGAYDYLNLFLKPNESKDYRKVDAISGKRLRIIRKTIAALYYSQTILSDEARQKLSAENQLSDIFCFLAECNKKYQEMQVLAKKANEEVILNFNGNVQKAFKALDDTLCKNGNADFSAIDHTYSLNVLDTSACRMWLIFEEASAENLDNTLPWDKYELSKTEDGYLFEIAQEEFNGGADRIGTIRCQNISAKIELFDYMKSSIPFGIPTSWGSLASALYELESKYWLEIYINEKERELLPLCSFEPILSFAHPGLEYLYDDETFALFYKFLEESNCQKLRPLLEAIKNANDEKQREKWLAKIRRELIKCEYEPLWRCIHAALQEATSEYPAKSDCLCPPTHLRNCREEVSGLLKAAGFTGEYPHFRKMGQLKKLRLVESNGIPYLLGHEKHMASYIDCFESFDDSGLTMIFVIGTLLLKKNQLDVYERSDAFCVFFEGNERRFGKLLSLSIPEKFPEPVDGLPMLSETVGTVIKKATLQKLSRSERKHACCDDHIGISTGAIGLFLALAGLLFGVVMIGVSMILEVIASLLLSGGSFAKTAELWWETPWWALFAFASLGFGGAMFVVALLARRNQ